MAFGVNRYDTTDETDQLNEEYLVLDEMIASAESLKDELDAYWDDFKISLSYTEEVKELIWTMQERQKDIVERLGEIEANAPREYGEL